MRRQSPAGRGNAGSAGVPARPIEPASYLELYLSNGDVRENYASSRALRVTLRAELYESRVITLQAELYESLFQAELYESVPLSSSFVQNPDI